jgi:hypothetical protein
MEAAQTHFVQLHVTAHLLIFFKGPMYQLHICRSKLNFTVRKAWTSSKLLFILTSPNSISQYVKLELHPNYLFIFTSPNSISEYAKLELHPNYLFTLTSSNSISTVCEAWTSSKLLVYICQYNACQWTCCSH